MPSTPEENSKVSDSVSKLSIQDGNSKSKKSKAVADSWDDESSESDGGDVTPALRSPVVPSAPPPTPHSATYGSLPGWNDETPSDKGSSRDGEGSKRPEKTDAVARRMIAAGLGLKAPKQTEEQRAYQRSIREQEKKRQEQEKGQEQRRREDVEKAKAAVWDS